MASRAEEPVVDLTQDDSAAEEVDDSHLVCYGVLRTNIVGIQYYTGTVNDGELVLFIREPDNAYDKWAVRVDNVLEEKIGHVPRTVVSHMAPLLDKHLLRVEGVVPRGSKNKYKMPVEIFCFGLPEDRPQVAAALRYADGGLQPLGAPSPPPQSQGGGWGAGGGAGGAGAERAKAAAPYDPTAGTTRLLPASQVDSELERMFEELRSKRGPVAEMDAAPIVTATLYPHQKQALAWMVGRENGCGLPPFWEARPGGRPISSSNLHYLNTLANFVTGARPQPMRGGILADDMGLGKSLEVIALIATNGPGAAPPPVRLVQQQEEGGRGEGPSAAQETPTAKRRKVTGATGSGPTPSTSASVPRGKLAEAAQAAEPPAAPPAADGPRTTLIVAPLSVLHNWEVQLAQHTGGQLKMLVYHGPDRKRSPAWLASHDVVLTTYSILGQEAAPAANGGAHRSGLGAVHWLRVVLDEGHNIRNANTRAAKAAAALRADRRWAVTGTPIQNNMKDLYGMLAFLRLDPLKDRSFFTRTIDRPIRQGDSRGIQRLQVLLGTLCLRRTKTMTVNGGPLVNLPPRNVHLVTVELEAHDRSAYDRWETEGRRVISAALERGELLRNYSGVLEIILRLRQICDASALCPHAAPAEVMSPWGGAGGGGADAAQLMEKLIAAIKEPDDDCPICMSDYVLPCITACAHVYCRACIESAMARSPTCPMCRAELSAAQLLQPTDEQLQQALQAPKGEEGGEDGGQGTQADAADGDEGAGDKAAASGALLPGGNGAAGGGNGKVSALIRRLAAAAGKGEKSVVFSQFTGFLGMVEEAIKAAGLPYVRLDGSTTQKRRAAAMTAFALPADTPGASNGGGGDGGAAVPMVFLASLRAGGEGLNLVAANHVHLLDPWWNPAVEEQAMDRVHRLGQTRPVNVFRYVAGGTIEERMLELQENKRKLAAVAFERLSPDQMREMRIADIKLLMEL